MNKKVKVILSLVLCISFILVSSLVIFAAIGQGQVNTPGSHLNLRAEPNTTSTIIHKLNDNEWVDLLSYDSSGWYKVETDDGYIGWVSAQYLDHISGP